MTSYLPKALFPNTVTLRIRFQHMNLGVRDTNIQSINGVRLSSLLQSELVLWLALTNRTQQKWLSGTSKFRPEEGWHFTSCTFELEPSCEKSRLHCEREATWSDCGEWDTIWREGHKEEHWGTRHMTKAVFVCCLLQTQPLWLQYF